MDSFIQLNNKKYTWDTVLKADPSSAYENSIIKFLNDWFKGKEYFIHQTSGSTGKPKEISIKRGQMIVSARQTIKALKLQPAKRALLCINPNFIGGKMMLVRAMVNQMDLIMFDPSANPLGKIPATSRFHFAAMVPLQLRNTINTNGEKLNNIEKLIIGGAPVSYGLQKQLSVYKTSIYATYGMTETVSHIGLKKLSPPAEKYFTVLGDTKLQTDKRGCLTIKGSVTASKTIITNDLVRLIDNAHFEWLGRFDNVINSGGVKVQPEKIESVISQYEILNKNQRFFIAGLPDNRLGQKVTLIVEGKSLLNISELKSLLSVRLNKYEVPQEITTLNKFIDTSSGKIDRAATLRLLN